MTSSLMETEPWDLSFKVESGLWESRTGVVVQTQGRPITDHQSTAQSEGPTWRGCTAAA